MLQHRVEVALGGFLAGLLVFSGEVVGQSGQRHLGVHDDIGIVREMDYHIRSHTFAAVLIRYDHP